MPCSICAHPEVAAIAAAVERGDSYRTIEGVYGVNKSSVSRHTRQCLTAVSVAPQAGTMAPMGHSPAPAHLVNPQVQQAATQIYAVLMNRSIIVDPRMAVAEVVRLLLQVVKDTGESAPQADEAAKLCNRL